MTTFPARREIQRRKIHEDVADYLLEDIRMGLYQVGQELPSERELMAEFAVGRPAIRESLAKLARMGVVELRPGMRAKVCPATVTPLLAEMDAAVKMSLRTPEGQRHMQEARLVFEGALARHVAPEVTEEQLLVLEAILAESRGAMDDPERFALLDVRFHRALGECTGNPLFVALYDAFGKWLLEQRLANFQDPARLHAALLAHQAMLDALRTGDPDKAEAAVRAHLTDVHGTYWLMHQDQDS